MQLLRLVGCPGVAELSGPTPTYCHAGEGDGTTELMSVGLRDIDNLPDATVGRVSARRPVIVVLGLLLAFALLVLVGGAVNSGYLHSRDYVSSLASRGADQAWIGMLAFASFAAAHAVAGLRWRRTGRIVWWMLLACSGLILIVGVARASCRDGAARCALPGRPSVTDIADTIHGLSVGIYLLTFALAAVCAGVVLLRHRRRGLGVAMLVLAVLSVLAVGQVDERTPGAEQRIWLAVNAVGLVALAASPLPREQLTAASPEIPRR